MRDVIVPIAVLTILASLLLPLPPSALDVLLIVNLLVSLVLLASSLYIPDPLKLSALPSMLLLGTLYRLSLNVCTTRMILNSAQAGRVIEAFGEVVIQGNLVVGVVIFLIITIIQFMVIAKGAERVAEVSARFTLDALPGKQMSIDADVRAGLIDFESARMKRQELQTESRFYGALDGAMKFIKGDAIAGLIIVAINIIGGFAVGVFSHGMPVSKAVSVYTLLTVGDGLVSQIPALLSALAAAIIVTRVSKGDGQSLARELPLQLGQLRSVKIVVGIIALLLGLIPNMPLLPFALFAVLLCASAFKAHPPDGGQTMMERFQPRCPVPLAIALCSQAARRIRGFNSFAVGMEALRNSIFDKTGIILTLPEIIPGKSPNSFQILVRGVEAATGPCAENAEKLCAELFDELERIVLSRLPEFVDDTLTRRSIDRLERESPELVAAVIPSVLSVTQLTELLRHLVRERVPISNLDIILQTIAEQGPKVKNERVLLEETRIALRRVITVLHRGSDNCIRALSLAPMIDAGLRLAEQESKPPAESLITNVLDTAHSVRRADRVILCSRGARRLLREIIHTAGYDAPVLAYEEICEDDCKVIYEETLGSSGKELLEALAA